MHFDGAQVRYRYLSLREYIRLAYEVKDYQISGPDWMAGAHFDVTAKLPQQSDRDQIRIMVRALLAERFQLAIHRTTKEFPVYALTVGKGGIRMKESPLEPETDQSGKPASSISAGSGISGMSVSLGRGASFTIGGNRIEAKKLTASQMADVLARFLDRPVVDRTNTTGTYDFTMEMTIEDYRAMLVRNALANGITVPPQGMQMLEASSGSSLFAAVEALGLKLEPRKASLEVLVIDHVEKVPTEN